MAHTVDIMADQLDKASEKSRLRWYRFTPDRLILALLPVEGVLWLSERFQWFGFNQHKGWTVLIAVASVGVFLLLMLLWFLAALVFRLQFQYSIRSLLVLTVAVALPFSWLAVELKQARGQAAAVEAIVKLHGRVWYDYYFVASSHLVPNAQPEPVWLRKLLGDHFFRSVTSAGLFGTQITDAGLEHLTAMTKLDAFARRHSGHGRRAGAPQEVDPTGSVVARRTQITDAGLEYLGGMTKLDTLDLDGTRVTDAGLEHLMGLTQLKGLYLRGTRVTDAGLERLKGLTRLEGLYLNGRQITDAGLEHLMGMAQLQYLALADTRVTDAGLEHLMGLTQLKELGLDGT